ncbi:MAG: YnbE family lipoprotein [Exilibacterium sp.]
MYKRTLSALLANNLICVALVCVAPAFVALTACTPTVKVAVPDKPIEINLNVKIQHEIRVKVDKELDELFEEDSELF